MSPENGSGFFQYYESLARDLVEVQPRVIFAAREENVRSNTHQRLHLRPQAVIGDALNEDRDPPLSQSDSLIDFVAKVVLAPFLALSMGLAILDVRTMDKSEGVMDRILEIKQGLPLKCVGALSALLTSLLALKFV